jgi:capsular exopolysaccharide synthesis family protein
MDQTFKSPQDVEGFLKLPVLGAIPKRKAKDALLIKDTKLITDYAQSYQNLSEQIYLLMKDKNLKSILITDAEASEETPAVIANLGIYLSHKAGHKALIIDANLRTPSMHRLFNVSNKPGLADVLEGKTSFDDAVQNVDSTLFVLPAGDTIFNPSTILDSSKLSNAIKTAKENYEVVFIACADLKNFTDAAVLASNVNNIVLVINEGKINRQVVKRVIAPLEQKKANLIGVILNNRSLVLPKIIYKLT